MSWWTGLPGGSRWRSSRTRARRVRPSRGRRPRGFTLLEIIVAFTILSVALVGLIQAFGTGLRGLGAAQTSAATVMLARSKLEEVGLTIPLEDGESSGETEDGYRWRVSIVEVEGLDLDDALGSIVIPYRVEVAVTGERGGALTLTTIRLGEPP